VLITLEDWIRKLDKSAFVCCCESCRL